MVKLDRNIINDKYNHNIGNEVLEEFILIIHVEKKDQVKIMLNRLILKLNQKILSSSKIKITVSGGVVLVDKYETFKDVNKIIALADKRLYIAKKNGKNQIVYDN